MIDPVALVEMVRRAPADHLREMGALFLELAERRDGNPDWDANMTRAIALVREQQAAALPRHRVTVPTIRRVAVRETPPSSERNP